MAAPTTGKTAESVEARENSAEKIVNSASRTKFSKNQMTLHNILSKKQQQMQQQQSTQQQSQQVQQNLQPSGNSASNQNMANAQKRYLSAPRDSKRTIDTPSGNQSISSSRGAKNQQFRINNNLNFLRTAQKFTSQKGNAGEKAASNSYIDVQVVNHSSVRNRDKNSLILYKKRDSQTPSQGNQGGEGEGVRHRTEQSAESGREPPIVAQNSQQQQIAGNAPNNSMYYLSLKSNIMKRDNSKTMRSNNSGHGKSLLVNGSNSGKNTNTNGIGGGVQALRLPLDDDHEYHTNNSISNSVSTNKKPPEISKSEILKPKLVPLANLMQSGTNLPGQQRILKYKVRKANANVDKSAVVN